MKLAEAKAILKEKKLDAIVLFSKTPNFQYLIPDELDHGVLIITKKENIIFVNPLHVPRLKGFKAIIYKAFRDELAALLKSLRIRKAGIDGPNLYVWQEKLLHKSTKTLDVSKDLSNLRVTKTPEEMRRIRKACEITDDVFSLIVKNFKSFSDEQDVAIFVKTEFLKRGADIAYEPIVASGKHAVTPHHDSRGPLLKGFLVLDIGAKYKGYCSDMTRTLYVGTPGMQEIKLYSKLLAIQSVLVRNSVVGASAKGLYEQCNKMLGSDAKYFIHSLGHGFGVEIHEAPSLGSKSDEKLKKNTVITIEPGYYNQKTGIGIRIEDDIYLGDKKEVLNKSTKNLVIVRR